MSSHSCLAFLIRHGATDSNLADPPILQGRSINGPLSQIGQQQATAAATELQQQRLVAIYASPLLRAQQTALVIAERHGLDVQTIPEITEVDVGAWESRSWTEICVNEPDAYHRFQDDPATFGYRDGENLQDVLNRVNPAIDAVLDRHPGELVAIVAHNVVNRVYLANALQIPLRRARQIAQNNCGINVLRRRDHQTKVITVNSVFHLAVEGLAPRRA